MPSAWGAAPAPTCAWSSIRSSTWVVADEQGAPAGGEPKASSEPEGAPEPEPARRSSLQLRYDPDGLAVTFEPGTSSAAARRAIPRVGATVEQAIPRINAYLAKGLALLGRGLGLRARTLA